MAGLFHSKVQLCLRILILQNAKYYHVIMSACPNVLVQPRGEIGQA